jgi:hypothetical protein
MEDLQNYYKVSVAAKMLGYKNRSTLHHHIKMEHIKATLNPNIGQLLIHKDDLLAFRYSKHYTGVSEDERK